MRCPNCGHSNIEGVDFCENCGTDLAGLDLPEAGAGVRGRLLSDHIADLPIAGPVVVAPEATVADAIAKMRSEKQGCVLVQDGSRLLGIFTEKDVLTRAVRPAIDLGATPVSEVMTPDPVIVAPGDPPAFAIHNRVARDLRHMPVVDQSRVVGFISVRHLLRYIQEDILGGG